MPVFTGNPADRVDGVALELTEADLSACDEYERLGCRVAPS
jgi:hypothetical protein